MDVKQLQDEFDKLRVLRVEYLRADRARTKAEKAWKAQMMRVRDFAEDYGLKNMSTAQGNYQVPEPTWFAQVQDFGAFERWAEANEPGLLRRDHKVSKQMNELVRDRIEDGSPLPPGLGAYPRRPVKVMGLDLDDDDDE